MPGSRDWTYYNQYLVDSRTPTAQQPESQNQVSKLAWQDMEHWAQKRKDLQKQRRIQAGIDKGEGIVINKFLLGCDPEWVALDANGRTMHLALHEEEIGTDHGGRVGEFRPKPCKGAYAL